MTRAPTTDESSGAGASRAPTPDTNVRVISRDQCRRLGRALEAVAAASDPLAALTHAVATVLEIEVAALTRRRGRWEITASGTTPAFPLPIAEPALNRLLDRGEGPAVECTGGLGNDWTLLRLSHTYRPFTVLALAAEWTLSTPFLSLFASSVVHALSASRALAQTGRQIHAYRMARRLGRVAGLSAVGDVIVRHMAEAVSARVAALCMPDSTGRTLSIVAAYGYARDLVAHLQIPAGLGIVGSVYETGRPLHIRGLADRPGARRRARYRTDSFIALPIRSGYRVVGVVCVTDRADDQAFTRRDVSALRALAAPAAIALERETSRLSAETYAHAAAIDPLTGAFNRRYFHVRLEEEVQRSRRHTIPLAMLMIDIDDFKLINDRFGHLAGDTVISDVAEIIRRAVRVFDICARFGGEEFAIIMPGSDADHAARVAERIRLRIESYQPLDDRFRTLRVTASIGVATSAADTTESDLIERADRALYEAKRSGKNRVSPADGTAQADALASGPPPDLDPEE